MIGAVGCVLLDRPETTMQPLIANFSRLQTELDSACQQLAAHRRLDHTIASFIGRPRRQACGHASALNPPEQLALVKRFLSP